MKLIYKTIKKDTTMFFVLFYFLKFSDFLEKTSGTGNSRENKLSPFEILQICMTPLGNSKRVPLQSIF